MGVLELVAGVIDLVCGPVEHASVDRFSSYGRTVRHPYGGVANNSAPRLAVTSYLSLGGPWRLGYGPHLTGVPLAHRL